MHVLSALHVFIIQWFSPLALFALQTLPSRYAYGGPTPVQIMRVLCCIILHKLLVCNFDFCKSLTWYMVCINW